MQAENETVEGRERAAIEHDGCFQWLLSTLTAIGLTFNGEDGLIEQIKQVYDSLSIA
ncbi:hypothetical protein [Glycomyces lechevalierae]|uniref:Uncharacterized protein n=3 Tax=Glycomyces TaxID=58113 RepID=A0A9X3PF02_9ACTN|nr:hypothetical protein [Glycomyces lechevalierae]MDA1384339.1 hypothetical protein [Glycomyces lechevalierae]MDR7339229.1 hypothetical protein [Glycomyces lechevalierae]